MLKQNAESTFNWTGLDWTERMTEQEQHFEWQPVNTQVLEPIGHQRIDSFASQLPEMLLIDEMPSIACFSCGGRMARVAQPAQGIVNCLPSIRHRHTTCLAFDTNRGSPIRLGWFIVLTKRWFIKRKRGREVLEFKLDVVIHQSGSWIAAAENRFP